jgi:signal transduction histidine kinase
VAETAAPRFEDDGDDSMSAERGRTILVVDDNDDDRTHIRRLLARHRPDYTITEAATGRDGLDLVRRAMPDCILLDYHLPDMDGTAFIEALRSGNRRGTLPVPVALLTGEQRDDIASSVLALGAQDYLVKDSLTPLGLVRAIENSIDKFGIQRELEEQRFTAEYRNRKLETLRTELQENLAELSDAQKARERFLAVMSHEMRTPLNAIMGYADLLEMELDGPLTEGQRRHIGRIRVGGRHLLDLVNDVLDIARADARRLELDLRPVDLYAVIEEVVALLQSQASTKGLSLTVDTSTPLPHVHADLQRLRQIATNLIGNAIKFTDEGSVSIRCDAPPGEVRMHVTDTGVGIDPDVLPLVFEDFYQAKNDLTREKGGSGLGLAIAKRLASIMGGTLSATSRLGEGSTFTLSLRPVQGELRADDVARQKERMQVMAAASRSPRTAATVVAFGADADALAALEQHLQSGVRLVWTTDPADIASLAVRENAALIVLDIGSAGVAAWRAASSLQEVPELAHTAVLLLPSIPAGSAEGTEGLDLGWVSLVPKPFTLEQLTRAVSVAAGRESRRPDGAHTGDGEDADRAFTVLVVDDDPDSRRVAATFLAQAHAHVREVADGETALIEMRRSPPDVVVLDLMMPVLDGFGVLAAMRTDPVLASVPVIVLTAKSLSEAEREFLARSTVRVLQKGEYRLADVAALVLRAARAPA